MDLIGLITALVWGCTIAAVLILSKVRMLLIIPASFVVYVMLPPLFALLIIFGFLIWAVFLQPHRPVSPRDPVYLPPLF